MSWHFLSARLARILKYGRETHLVIQLLTSRLILFVVAFFFKQWFAILRRYICRVLSFNRSLLPALGFAFGSN